MWEQVERTFKSQWARFHCNVATANVLSLMPNSKKMNPMGLQGKARTESIMQMAQEAQLHIVGLQETRVKKLPKSDTEHYFVFGGAASQSGHYGTQLWFSKSHALDVDNRCFFERSHFKILCQGERILSIRVWAPFFRAVVVCAHAPHTQHAEEDRKMWWENLKNSTPHKYKDWPHVLLIDANARVGEFPNQHVGDHQGDLQDSNGDYLTEYLMEYNLWLPSTFDTVHEGAGGTWHHHNKDTWCRGDYVALPMQWQLEFCHSAVRPDIDITLTKQDHQVVYAGFRWQGLTSSGSKKPSWSYVKYDTAGLIDYFKGQDGDSWRNSLRSILPDCDWSTDVHSHTAILQRNLAHWMQNSCGPLRATPKKKTMSQETWTLVQRKRALRKEFFDNSASRRRSTLRAVFDCWKGEETLWPLETKDDAHKAAQDLHELQGLSRQVTAALRKDDVAYFQNVAASMGDADDPTAGQNIWRKIRWALPKFKQRSQQSPLLLDSLDDQWYGHFADLEAGHMVTPEELLQRCTTRQRKRARQPVKSLSLLPTLVDTEKVLRRVQANKTPGPDQLPNSSCFQVLQQAAGDIDENIEIVKAPPSRVAGMRLDALDCNGPFAPYPREVDNLQCQAESELDELQKLRTNYPTYDSIDLEIVEKFSGNFGQALEQWRLYHGQGDPEGYELWNIFIDLFAEFETPVETFEFVFIEWYRHILPDLLGQWEDGGLEVIAENTFYGLTQEMEYMKIIARVDVLQNQLRGLQKKRQQEDEAPPHRPVRLGPMNRRGGIRQFKPALRRYLNEDKWQEQCEALQWETSVKDKETPIYMQVANKPCYLIVHLFSGRRRSLDYHDAVMRLAEGKSFEVRVISLDTAVHSTIGDLSAGKETWSNIEELPRAGRLAGALAGPPCETFTEARHHLPPDLPPEERKFWPRPLRSAKAPWGLDGLTYKEMLQLRTGTRFALQVAWLFVAMLCYGGHMMIEHPGPPRDGEKVSIFRTPIYALLLRLPECALRIIRQQFWGAAAVKPTGILALRLPYFYASMNKWKMASEDLAAVEPAIGRNRDGSFKTSGLKEYPALLSQGLAQCSVDALQRISMTGVSRQSSHTVNHHLLKWCEAALKATEQIDEAAAMMPDYQG